MDATTLGVIAVCATFAASAAGVVWRFSGLTESVNNLTRAVDKLTGKADQGLVDIARLQERVGSLEKEKK